MDICAFAGAKYVWNMSITILNTDYLVDIFYDVVEYVRTNYDASDVDAPYYDHGHPLDINNKLTQKSKAGSFKYKKYPLIALIQDFTESHGGSYAYNYTTSPKILIVDYTKQTYNSQQRYENVFKPVLYPLYNLLLDGILDSLYIDITSIENLVHTKTDRLYWGKVGIQGNDGKIFNDFLDAIEIDFADLPIIRQTNTCENDFQS